MSAKDRRKSLALTLDPLTYAALGAYRRAHGARSMSEAARRCLRGALGRVVDMPADNQADTRAEPRAEPRADDCPGGGGAQTGSTPRPLRLQLERDLSCALAGAAPGGAPASADAVARHLRDRLAALGFRVAHESAPRGYPEKS